MRVYLHWLSWEYKIFDVRFQDSHLNNGIGYLFNSLEKN